MKERLDRRGVWGWFVENQKAQGGGGDWEVAGVGFVYWKKELEILILERG